MTAPGSRLPTPIQKSRAKGLHPYQPGATPQELVHKIGKG